LTVHIERGEPVSGLLEVPANARACYVLAHGAGAGMNHPFIVSVAKGLAARGIATLRYQFPYMERGSRRPDPPQVAQAVVRAAVAAASHRLPELPLFAGGKSYGGRMTSQAQAASPLAGVRGIAFLGFPLHAAGRPSRDRAQHLSNVRVPMLFVQGDRDALADLQMLKPVVESLGERATLAIVAGADHSFRVRAASSCNDEQARTTVLDELAGWIAKIAPGNGAAAM
jgi:predicted alpha/beta-hydrolase family hydrolase